MDFWICTRRRACCAQGTGTPQGIKDAVLRAAGGAATRAQFWAQVAIWHLETIPSTFPRSSASAEACARRAASERLRAGAR
jgi:hypothetical protein